MIKALLHGQNLDGFLQQDDNEDFLPRELDIQKEMINDYQAAKIVKSKFGIDSPSLIRCFEKEKRDEAIVYLKSVGLSIRKIEKLTGISRGIAQNIIENS